MTVRSGKHPAVKGTLCTRAGLGLKVTYLSSLKSALLIRKETVQFSIKLTLSCSFPRKHASTPSWKHPSGEGNCGNLCLKKNCTVPTRARNVVFSNRGNSNVYFYCRAVTKTNPYHWKREAASCPC